METFIRGNVKEILNIGENRMSPDTQAAMNRLRKSLREDQAYYYGWQANIAMQFQDHVYWFKKKHNKKYLNRKDFHEISNDAAKAFLELIM